MNVPQTIRPSMITAAAILSVALLKADAQQGGDDPTGVAGELPAPQAIFNGEDFEGWVTRRNDPVTRGWVVEDGCLHRQSGGGDIYTKKAYGDFILLFDWKVAPGANSGIKYRCDEKSMIGPEYQILDDQRHANGKNPKTSACSLYAVKAPVADKPLVQPGQWNRGKIVAIGTRYEHWVNGVKVLEVDTDSEEWKQLKARSKYRNNDAWGVSPTGRIMLQDHGDPVWYRNLVIMDLSARDGKAAQR